VASGNISILIGQEMSDEGIICVKVVIDCWMKNKEWRIQIYRPEIIKIS
jgi:hypothetical protein